MMRKILERKTKQWSSFGSLSLKMEMKGPLVKAYLLT